ncbi:hypothetical protein [Nocardia sp. alder85J]|uniref:hypothetical protein n=1 Tax=Nocardia sp. alder85J TaxID=2862949 RepID=UPI001CD78C16|nr:hypothetical protein [Nocardia sp. alder85J]MCX4098158.1 hypothetical protein [Nocardia sp. alder85J]
MVSRWLSLLVFVWLVVGLVAALQRGYLTHPSESCLDFATILVNVAAGPLNYLGLDPKVSDCVLPQPSR